LLTICVRAFNKLLAKYIIKVCIIKKFSRYYSARTRALYKRKSVLIIWRLVIINFMYPQPSGNIEDTKEFVRISMMGLSEGTNLQLVILDKAAHNNGFCMNFISF